MNVIYKKTLIPKDLHRHDYKKIQFHSKIKAPWCNTVGSAYWDHFGKNISGSKPFFEARNTWSLALLYELTE